MRFSTRLFLFTALPALLFTVALGVSLWALMRVQGDFTRYIGTDQAVASGLSQMYAQGLQSGQALRNILLDPTEGKAYENLDAANQTYDSAYRETLRVAQDSPLAAQVATLGALRATQVQVQAQVRSLASSDIAAARALLNTQETPAWRKLRAALLEQMDSAGKNQALVRPNAPQRQSDALAGDGLGRAGAGRGAAAGGVDGALAGARAGG